MSIYEFHQASKLRHLILGHYQNNISIGIFSIKMINSIAEYCWHNAILNSTSCDRMFIVPGRCCLCLCVAVCIVFRSKLNLLLFLLYYSELLAMRHEMAAQLYFDLTQDLLLDVPETMRVRTHKITSCSISLAKYCHVCVCLYVCRYVCAGALVCVRVFVCKHRTISSTLCVALGRRMCCGYTTKVSY